MNRDRRDLVAIILAIGLATALNMLMAAVLWDALFNSNPGLSENATQVITAMGSGVIGILGGYIGGRAVAAARRDDTQQSSP
jgi:hypothetical protein